jgi:hypothetical protein
MPSLSAEKYHVGWICALEIEMAAARAMLDEDYGPVRQKIPGITIRILPVASTIMM